MEHNNEIFEEEWREILYHNRYDVSNLGNFRYRGDKGIRPVKPSRNSSGYYTITIGGKTYYCHKLVAKHFCLRDKEDKIVVHINGNKKDMRAENLVWCEKGGKSVISLSTQHKYPNLMAGCQAECVNYRAELQRISSKSKHCRFMYW